MYVLYTDDSILAGPNKDELDQIIEDIKGTGLDITDEGDIADFLGVNIQREGESSHLTQPKLIDSILEDLHLKEDSHIKDIPMASRAEWSGGSLCCESTAPDPGDSVSDERGESSLEGTGARCNATH